MNLSGRIASWAEARILSRIVRWLDALGRLWGEHWLLLIGGFLVCSSLLLRWINFPLSRTFNAFQLPLIGTVGLVPHYHLLSHGLVVLLVFALGIAATRFSRLPLLLAAAVLITIFVALPCVVFEEPALLHRLSDEVTDVSLIENFSRRNLPPNYGYIEDIPSHLEVSTAWGRLMAANSFLALGWACFGWGTLLFCLYALARNSAGSRAIKAVCLCLPACVLAILFVRPLTGQHYFVQARIDQAQGHNEQAITNYRKAMWWDRWSAEDINTYAIIGDLQRQSNIAPGSAERHIKQALMFKEAGQFESAIFELNQATQFGGFPGLTARRESARTHLEFGLALYRAGAIGAAVTNWQQSLAENPIQVQPLVYLARGNYELADYVKGLDAADEVVKAAGLNSVLANGYSLGGDCYTKLGDDDKARHYYARSVALDNFTNLWALSALAGD